MPPPPDGHHPAEGISGSELRRDVSVWGSYMWGYAAVGADIYTALGIITLAALGLAPLAFIAADHNDADVHSQSDPSAYLDVLFRHG